MSSEIQFNSLGEVAETTVGPRCGCSMHGDAKMRRTHPVHHANAASVKACFAEHAYRLAQVEAEAAAERAAERYLEDRGWAEAAAERQWEDARGVVQFSDAMAAAAASAEREEAYWDAKIAEREAREDNLVADWKMARDMRFLEP